ncbi:MerR family transcriptional regulator [Actinoplanes sp. L3-i22]|uniref:MerR family transcriptional regulator n=1 Tax=Actinoplanes sp. L3-i22 TaxID=2836373 RepID=UPI001C85AE4C|nr:MerR family transcriptional regulator [Actinoplanes sp. L3-i22]
MSSQTTSMSTAEFGRLAGLSTKALRLYDASGLLPPAEVEQLSGYRRYTADQLEPARRISLLRRLGAPLTLIGDLLPLPDIEAVTRLDRWWAGEDAAMEARRASYFWLRTRLAHGDDPEKTYSVRIERDPARKVACTRVQVDQQGLVPAIGTAQWAIRAHLDEHGAVHGPGHWVIYHGLVTPESEATVEVCVPCAGPVEPSPAITLRMEPERLLVFATVLRDDCFYPRITAAYDAVQRHIAEAGLVTAGPPREIYLNHWESLTGEDPFAQVAQPIEEC